MLATSISGLYHRDILGALLALERGVRVGEVDWVATALGSATSTFSCASKRGRSRRGCPDQADQRRCRDVASGCDRAGVVAAGALGRTRRPTCRLLALAVHLWQIAHPPQRPTDASPSNRRSNR